MFLRTGKSHVKGPRVSPYTRSALDLSMFAEVGGKKKKKRFQESQPIGTLPWEELCAPSGRGLGTRVALGLQWGHSILEASFYSEWKLLSFSKRGAPSDSGAEWR